MGKKAAGKSPKRSTAVSASSGLRLVHVMLAITLVGLAVCGAFMREGLMAMYKVHSQISQLVRFDEAVENFHGKYEGLPGDLLSVAAERQGLPAGDGTPGHSDGDGKISPCNPGWQWHLGCETALFWSHLYLSEMLSENFSADSHLTNARLKQAGSMVPYLPKSAIDEDVYITVWNTDASQPSPKPHLPYGNYYELSRITGITEEKMSDNSKAISPEHAYAIDLKMDDGMPLSGRISVNGEADWPKDAWGTYAKPDLGSCVFTDKTYNTRYFLRAKPVCHLAIKIECCEKL